MKTEFNKDLKGLKNKRTEKILPMKNSLNQIKASLESLTNRMAHEKDWTISVWGLGKEEFGHSVKANDKLKNI